MTAMIVCPNCFGRTCVHCLPYGVFGLVPEHADVEIALITGRGAQVPHTIRALRKGAEWLTGDGGADEWKKITETAYQEAIDAQKSDDEDADVSEMLIVAVPPSWVYKAKVSKK